ncbi:f-box domain-containing protein [Fusarium mexicanum]|uniref:F-box domain-containing protein n=1 Tax=Fusarium mexicanum TaxID=751941 RepID=A0A8H5MUU1_9HYPO|nr:f-box domain-containing protein [Fusarium mexicanum]
MLSNLQTCPENLLEIIVALLSLDDIRNLRLTCRSLVLKSTGYTLRKFFLNKHVDLTHDSLLGFARVCKNGGISTTVQNLYLTGSSAECEIQTWQANDANEARMGLLVQAFDSLANRKRDSKMKSITIRIAVFCDGIPLLRATARERRSDHVRECTKQTFSTVIRALASSNLRVETLNIFNDPDLRPHRPYIEDFYPNPQTIEVRKPDDSGSQQCTLPFDELNGVNWNDPGLAESLATLTSLSIGICTPDARAGPTEELAEENKDLPRINEVFESSSMEAPTDCGSMSRLLQLCPLLKDFELRYFHVRLQTRGAAVGDITCEKVMQRLAELEGLPFLDTCRLRGICARGEDVLGFIKRTKVRELSMETIKLSGLKYQSLFNHCTAESANITKLYFDNLYEMERREPVNRRRVHFLGEGRRRTEWMPPEVGNEILGREGRSVKRPIVYHMALPMCGGTPAHAEWTRFHLAEYGFG